MFSRITYSKTFFRGCAFSSIFCKVESWIYSFHLHIIYGPVMIMAVILLCVDFGPQLMVSLTITSSIQSLVAIRLDDLSLFHYKVEVSQVIIFLCTFASKLHRYLVLSYPYIQISICSLCTLQYKVPTDRLWKFKYEHRF